VLQATCGRRSVIAVESGPASDRGGLLEVRDDLGDWLNCGSNRYRLVEQVDGEDHGAVTEIPSGPMRNQLVGSAKWI
jgi:hypothetical protein